VNRCTSIIASATVLLASGCAELTVYETPYAQGTVIDAATGRAIPSASITVKGRSEVSTTTSPDGTFVLKSATHKIMYPALPYDAVSPSGVVVVSAPGYEPREVQLTAGANIVAVQLQLQK
jgi:hypothetical protein